MYQESDIKQMVRDILRDVLSEQVSAQKQKPGKSVSAAPRDEGFVPDITAESTKEQFFVPAPADRDGYLRMKEFTPARIGVWRAGPRYNTFSMLRFRADHATAQDAVFTDVPEEVLKQHNFLCGQSMCSSRDEFITRPDLGRRLNDETRALFKKELPQNAKVLLMTGDGLSSAAVSANAADVIPSIKQGLKQQGIEIGTIPFVKYCRVGAMDEVGPLTGAEVVCLLIGERPGLVTAESMSAYMAYKPNPDKPEAWRTVVSNINRGGTPPAEAGAHIAGILKKILDAKVSGVDLNL
ncbi:MAG: ethanolamine ammonia-lyase subunit EutC [Synergistaceae bacterium]|jgi:ethanolamine ammonia-lyase small subunit|nr:ethanolamine ammonia-lyase subunit EutC [Synergistaceae bacterium]